MVIPCASLRPAYGHQDIADIISLAAAVTLTSLSVIHDLEIPINLSLYGKMASSNSCLSFAFELLSKVELPIPTVLDVDCVFAREQNDKMIFNPTNRTFQNFLSLSNEFVHSIRSSMIAIFLIDA